MKLDELNWQTWNSAKEWRFAALPGGSIFRKFKNCSDEEEFFVYFGWDGVKPGFYETITERWDELDALTAQAVLFHLLPTE